jgi:hypothetical protein
MHWKIICMNAKIIEIYNKLYPHVLQLRIRWAQFRFLFTVSDKRMIILENTAPGFFAIIKDVLRDDAFISLSRLTDKSSTFGKNNLTLVSLVELAEKSDNVELASSARVLLEQLLNRVNNMRKWRDKWLAHTDFDQAILDRPLPDTGVQRGHVDDAIRLTTELMNLFAHHLAQKSFGNDLPIVPGDADVLARLLESMQES